MEVAPLPEEIMNGEATLWISPDEAEAHTKKKHRRRLRHEQWLQSKDAFTNGPPHPLVLASVLSTIRL